MNAPEQRTEVEPYLAQDAKAMPLAPKTQFSLAPRDLAQAIEFAELLSKSNMIPKEFVGNTGNILVAVQWGMELGLQPMQAMQNIAVINGRPSLWGDAVIGIVKASPLCEYVTEEVTDTSATCRVKRRGEPEQSRIFTMEDAQRAGLKGKQGPWTQYPKRMMQMRARSWALRDVFPDVLRGMPVAEEVMDIEPRDITPGRLSPQSENCRNTAERPPYPEDKFKAKLAGWQEQVSSGARSAEDIFASVSTRYTFTDAQKDQIRAGKHSGELLASEDQIKHIRANAEDGGITEADIFKRFNIQSLDNISAEMVEPILAFISDPVGA